MTTASSYFTGPKPMFGPDGFADRFTPTFAWYRLKCDHHWNIWASTTDQPHGQEVDAASALALCEKAAQGWIRSKGWRFRVDVNGMLTVRGFGAEWSFFDPGGTNPNWLRAAMWVNEQVTK